MTSATQLRRLLMLGAASVALVACSDTDIDSPGGVAPPPAPAPTPPPPAGSDFDLVPDGFDASHPNIDVVERDVGGTTIEVAQISGTVETDLTIQAGVGYFLEGTVFVGNDAGATTTSGTSGPAATPEGTEVIFTIEPGAEIYGDGPNSGLVIARGSRIIADGTAAQPIIMTSLNEYLRQEGSLPADPNARSEWLGLVINGFAPINKCDVIPDAVGGSADCQDDGEANSGVYGGDQPEDNSGILDYVRVEHAGVFFNEEDQSNGIAFQGVGSGTQVSNIQVHNNGDDGIEFFGGTVSATNVVLTGIADDAVDWTDGWTGSLQRVLVIMSEDEADYAIEADNRSSAEPDQTPRSNPKLSNFTFVGNGQTTAIRLREGTAVTLANGIVTNFETGLDIDDQVTLDLLASGPSTVDGAESVIASHLFNNTSEIEDDDDPAAGNAATIAGALQDVLTGTELASPDFVPGPEVGAIPVFDVTGIGELEDLGFIGAFAPTETVADNWAAGWTKPGTVFADTTGPATCPTGLTQDGRIGDRIVCAITGTVTEDLTLSNGDEILYRLDGQIFVGTDGGPEETNTAGSIQATLTVDAGVTVFGDSATDGIVITRGSEISVNGTAANPVVFTSGPAVRGLNDYATATGQWLGLSINGKAPINKCDVIPGAAGGTADCQDDGEASSGVFGGDVADDDSGNINYLRLEFSGIFFNEDDQSNGIAFQGVGSGSEFSHIQVHNNGDDGIEFFGGTADARYVVITGAGDDAVDWTDGWVGRVQYALIESKPGDGHGFEGDNRSEAAPDTQPRSLPQIANYTILGAVDTSGARFREGMGGDFVNGIIVNTADGLDPDDRSNDLLTGDFGSFGVPADGATLDIASLFLDTADNVIDDADTDPAAVRSAITNLVEGTTTLNGFSFYGKTGIGVVPGINEANVTATDPATLNDAGETFFETTTYIGAVENDADDWYLGWTVDSTGNVTSAN